MLYVLEKNTVGYLGGREGLLNNYTKDRNHKGKD